MLSSHPYHSSLVGTIVDFHITGIIADTKNTTITTSKPANSFNTSKINSINYIVLIVVASIIKDVVSINSTMIVSIIGTTINHNLVNSLKNNSITVDYSN